MSRNKMGLLSIANKLHFGKYFSTQSTRFRKVAVLGAVGGVGRSLSLLLKTSDLVSELALYDLKYAPGVACDLSHINTNSVTYGVDEGPDNLSNVLTGAEVVVIAAGLPTKPGLTREDLFEKNASIVKQLVDACAQCCPKALIPIVTNPVNSIIPIAAETMKLRGVYDPKRVFGVTTIDILRASTFLGNFKGIEPSTVRVPVIGGHSDGTIVPVLSQVEPKVQLDEEEVAALTSRIRLGGSEVRKAKAGTGASTVATGYAAARFTLALLRGLNGDNVVECAYVPSTITEVSYFASPVLLGKDGIEEILPLPPLTQYEKDLLTSAKIELVKAIHKSEKFMKAFH